MPEIQKQNVEKQVSPEVKIENPEKELTKSELEKARKDAQKQAAQAEKLIKKYGPKVEAFVSGKINAFKKNIEALKSTTEEAIRKASEDFAYSLEHDWHIHYVSEENFMKIVESENYRDLVKGINGWKKEPWAKNVVLKMIELHPAVMNYSIVNVMDQSWAKEAFEEALKHDDGNHYLMENLVNTSQRWAGNSAMALEVARQFATLDAVWKEKNIISDDIWFMTERLKIEETNDYDTISKYFKDPNILSHPRAKEIVKIAAQKLPGTAALHADKYIDQPWAMAVLMEGIKSEKADYNAVSMYFQQSPVFKTKPGAGDLLKIAAQKQPFGAAIHADKYIDQPWAMAVLMEGMKSEKADHLAVGMYFQQSPVFKTKPGAGDLLKIAAQKAPFYAAIHADNYIDQPWAISVLMEGMKSEKADDQAVGMYFQQSVTFKAKPGAGDILKIAAQKAPKVAVENVAKFYDQPYAKEIMLPIVKADPEMIWEMKDEIPEGATWKKEIVGIAEKAIEEKSRQ